MSSPRPLLALALLAATATFCHPAEPVVVSVSADKPGADINPSMWGLFFEDINFGADGGLYAELVKNRSFEFPDPLMGWRATAPDAAAGTCTVRTDDPAYPKNPHYVRVASRIPEGYGIVNEGFRGMGVRSGEAYEFSATVRSPEGNIHALRLELLGSDGEVIARSALRSIARNWGHLTAVLRPKVTDARASLRIAIEGTGAVDLDQVSLFPRNTWKNRPGGLRADMVQALADVKPGFLRFPGGCIVEGPRLDLRYRWKNTIGPVEERPYLYNRWNGEFKDRATPDYYQSFGLGFFEYFQLCEDIGAKPLPILNCGMACQYNSGELAPLDELQPYIQDALDLIEFANGPVSSPWGAKRAAMGHPEPFHMTMLGVGNEQWGPQYFERYTRFAEVLKKAHPEITLVSCAGPSPDDKRFTYAWSRLRELHADIVDEHVYAGPEWFFANSHRYDHYDRNGPKVFMGEYAARTPTKANPRYSPNTLENALSEAAFMTGLERNADVVRMASYAPLFANADAWQWTPDLIWVDSLHVRPTPDYWVQYLFSRNRGDHVLPCSVAGLAAPKSGSPEGLYASSVVDGADIVVKLVHASPTPLEVTVALDGVRSAGPGTTTVLTGSGPLAENTAAQPANVAPRSSAFAPGSNRFTLTLPAWSMVVLRLPVSR